MGSIELALIAQLSRHPATKLTLESMIGALDQAQRDRLTFRISTLPTVDPTKVNGNGNGAVPGLMSADTILTTKWPEPVWVVPGLIPTGLTILGGAPKLGKSWLALQITLAVGCGGYLFGNSLERRKVLYLALEDTPTRIQDRMTKLQWPAGVDADFFTVGSLKEYIKDFDANGAEKLANLIERTGYSLVIIDTISRVFKGDKNEEKEVNAFLEPLQEMSHLAHIALLVVHHHGKAINEDVVRDLMGSTAFGGMADTLLGIYRERGKPGARLQMTGRDLEDKTLEIRFDAMTHCWQADSVGIFGMDDDTNEILQTLIDIGPAQLSTILRAIKKEVNENNKQNVRNALQSLEKKGKVTIRLNDRGYSVYDVVRDE